MDYTELKIGDLVECGLSQVARVQAITNEYVGVDIAINDYYTLPINKVKPIQLTEEILKRNGWQEEHKEWRKSFPYDIFILAPYIHSRTKEQWWSVDAVIGSDRTALHDIRYVHELQHILWALGFGDKMEV